MNNHKNIYAKIIDRLPRSKGALVFPISLAKMVWDQSASALKDTLYDLLPKIPVPWVSANFVYGTELYQRATNSVEESLRYTNLSEQYHRWLIKTLNKSPEDFYQQPLDIEYFQYMQRSQLRLLTTADLLYVMNSMQEIFDIDTELQEHMQQDAIDCWRELTTAQRDFFLEETIILGFIAKHKLKIPQNRVANPNRHLIAYPWAPIRHHIYMMQRWYISLDYQNKNMLSYSYNPKRLCQPFEYSWYDHKSKLLYDMSKIDLNNYEKVILNSK